MRLEIRPDAVRQGKFSLILHTLGVELPLVHGLERDDTLHAALNVTYAMNYARADGIGKTVGEQHGPEAAKAAFKDAMNESDASLVASAKKAGIRVDEA